MSKRQKRQISRELAAIASLKDSDIDTSDVPEITDWSQAVVGRAYQSPEAGSSHSASSVAAFTPLPLPGPDAQRFTGSALSETTAQTQQFTGANLAAMTSQQLIVEFVQGHAAAWEEFVRRFQKLIASVVVRTCMRWGNISPEVADDLIQEVYLKLWENDCQLLRKFDSPNDNAIFGYLKVVTANVVLDYFRSAHSAKRATGSASYELNLDPAVLRSSGAAAEVENAVLIEEIDRVLKATASERERAVFWLYYRDGLSAKTIASLPAIRLTVRGVQSVILRLAQTLRRELAQALPPHQSQRGAIEILRQTPSPKKKKD